MGSDVGGQKPEIKTYSENFWQGERLTSQSGRCFLGMEGCKREREECPLQPRGRGYIASAYMCRGKLPHAESHWKSAELDGLESPAYMQLLTSGYSTAGCINYPDRWLSSKSSCAVCIGGT